MLTKNEVYKIINDKNGLSGKYTKPKVVFMEACTKYAKEYINEENKNWIITRNIWHIINKIDQPKCLHCLVKFCSWLPTYKKYSNYCSIYCQNHSVEHRNKLLEFNSSDEGKESIRKKTIKTKTTNVEKYGTVSYLTSDYYKKSRIGKTNFISEDTRNIFITTMNEKVRPKIVHFSKMESGLTNYRNVCIKRLGIENVTDAESFKTYLINEHHNKERTIQNIAKEIKLNTSSLARWFDRLDIEIKYFFTSTDHIEIVNYLKNIGVSSIKENNRNIIKNTELDIYLPEHNLAIEYCGLYWHSELFKDKNYHKNKYEKCKEKGIRLLTIFQNEWVYNKNIVKSKLKNILNLGTETIYARKCKIVRLKHYSEVSEFMANNHIQGAGRGGSYLFGITYNDNLIGCMIFKKSKDSTIILDRYATSHTVVGGFSKCLKYASSILKTDGIDEIESFADLRWSVGNLYIKNEFTEKYILSPDYSYIRNDSLFHKFNFRHTRLRKMKQYDSTLSESENMKKMNIHKIYDCGKIKYVKTI